MTREVTGSLLQHREILEPREGLNKNRYSCIEYGSVDALYFGLQLENGFLG